MEENIKHYQRLIEKYNKLIEKNSNDSDIYFKRGNARAKIMDYTGAVDDYTLGIKEVNRVTERSEIRAIAKVELKEYYKNRAVAKTKLKDYQGAISDYSEAIERSWVEDSEELHIKRGFTKRQILDFKGALEDYKESIRIGKLSIREFTEGNEILEKLEKYRIESNGNFWQKRAIEVKKINQQIEQIEKEIEADNYKALNEIFEDIKFKRLLQNLKEGLELSKYEKLPPIKKAKAEYKKGNYTQAMQILTSNDREVTNESSRLFLKLELKLLDKTIKIDSMDDDYSAMLHDIDKNKNYIEIKKHHHQIRQADGSDHRIYTLLKKLFNEKNIRFGKYKGYKLLDIIKKDPKYIIEEIINNTHFFISDTLLYELYLAKKVSVKQLVKALEFNIIKSELFESWIAGYEDHCEKEERNNYEPPSWGDNRDAFDTAEQYNDWANQ